MAINPKYEFYEKVIVETKDSAKSAINNELGAVLGRAQNDDGIWGYAIHIYRDSEVWDVPESELKTTGEFDTKESFYNGESIKVTVDKNGQGKIEK